MFIWIGMLSSLLTTTKRSCTCVAEVEEEELDDKREPPAQPWVGLAKLPVRSPVHKDSLYVVRILENEMCVRVQLLDALCGALE